MAEPGNPLTGAMDAAIAAREAAATRNFGGFVAHTASLIADWKKHAAANPSQASFSNERVAAQTERLGLLAAMIAQNPSFTQLRGDDNFNAVIERAKREGVQPLKLEDPSMTGMIAAINLKRQTAPQPK